MVKIIVDNIYSKIVGIISDTVQKDLNDTLSYKIANARHMPQVKNGHWDGVIRLYFKHKGQSFHTGLLSLVREIFKKHNVEFEILDKREKPEQNYPELKFISPPNFEQRDYQDFTIERAIKFTRGILCLCTGAGKTAVTVRLMAQLKTYPFIFYVLTKDLMEQAYGVLSECLNVPIGRIGDGMVDIQKINVCTIQTAVRILNSKNDKFKISDYKFDDEDEWDEKFIENQDDIERGRKLIGMAKGLYLDECLYGDAKVRTEKGIVKIKDIQKNKCRFVQTSDGINIIYRPIVRWWDNGIKETLDINLSNGENIQCTENHLLLTQRGWIKAKNINLKDRLFCVNVDAAKKLPLQTSINHKNLFSDIKFKLEQKKNGEKFIRNMSKDCHFVNVDVKTKFFPDIKHSKNLYREKGVKQGYLNILMGMTNNQYSPNIISLQVLRKSRQLLEHAWEIHALDYPMEDLKISDYLRHMDYVKKNGQNIKLFFYKDTTSNLELSKMGAMENYLLNHGLPVFLLLPQLHQNCIKMVKKELDTKFLILSEQSDLHGGYATMDRIALDVSHCTQKDGLIQKTELYGDGLINKDFAVKFKNVIRKIKNTIALDLTQKDQNVYQNISENIYPNAWNTNWTTIKSIKKGKKQRVYDIEVKDTHCFFANNTLVHNCHHASSRTVKEVLEASPYAYWKYGGTATPVREDGADIMLQALFGAKIVDISASYLIKRGDLVKPYIFMEPIDSKVNLHSYQKVYEACVVKNEKFNKHVAETVNYLVGKKLSVLVLVQQYKQGEYLKTLIPNSEFITGKVSSEKRKQYLNDLREGKITLIGTSLADEGIDVKGLDVVVMAGGGKSVTRISQRIGRCLRKDKKAVKQKDRAIVIIYEHNAKYLDKHAKKVRSILKKEPEFEVISSNGPDFIYDEIDRVLGVDSDRNNVFK